MIIKKNNWHSAGILSRKSKSANVCHDCWTSRHFYVTEINCSQITDAALTNVSSVGCIVHIALTWRFRANVSPPLRLYPEINHAAIFPRPRLISDAGERVRDFQRNRYHPVTRQHEDRVPISCNLVMPSFQQA